MAITFHPYDTLAGLLPQRLKDKIDAEVSEWAKNNLGKDYKIGKIEPNCYPFVIALGVMIAIGGIFLILAAHQVLPHGVNAFSNLMSYCVLGLGVSVAVIGAVKTYLIHRANLSIAQTIEAIGSHKDKNECYVISDYYIRALGINEFCLVDRPSKKELRIYIRSTTNFMSTLKYKYTASAQEEFERRSHEITGLLGDATCITLETLYQRVADFERNQK